MAAQKLHDTHEYIRTVTNIWNYQNQTLHTKTWAILQSYAVHSTHTTQ